MTCFWFVSWLTQRGLSPGSLNYGYRSGVMQAETRHEVLARVTAEHVPHGAFITFFSVEPDRLGEAS